MIKLSKEKRTKIIIVAACSLLLSVSIWYVVIQTQKKRLLDFQDKFEMAQDQVDRANRQIKSAKYVQDELQLLRGKVNEAEGQLIPSDQLSNSIWVYGKLNPLLTRFDLTLTMLSSDAMRSGSFVLFPEFEYSAASYDVTVRGYYHHFGRFLAELENNFPYLTVDYVEMTPIATQKTGSGPASEATATATAAEVEKLIVSFRLVVLYPKPAGSS